MDEREVARLYIAEMRALLPILRSHLDTLGGVEPGQRMGVASEFGRLARAAADLSADFHAEDCATLAAALARAFPYSDALPVIPAVLDPAADALTYLQTRITRMDAAHRILAPAEGERAAAARVLAVLCAASGQVMPGGGTTTLDLTDDVQGLPANAQRLPPTLPGEERPLPPPTTGPLSLTELQSYLAGSPSAPAAVPPAPPSSAEERSQLSPGAAPGAWDAGGPMGVDEPLRVPLSDEDRAILNAFRTGPLRRSTAPLPPETLARFAPPLRQDAATAVAAQRSGPEPGVGDEEDDLASDGRMRDILIFEVTQDLQEIQHLLVTFEQQPTKRSLIQAMGRIAHKMKGAAGTLGFEVLADLAHGYEDQLAAVQRQRVPADTSSVNMLLQGLSELDRALATIVAGQSEEPSAVQRMTALTVALVGRTSGGVGAYAVPPTDQGPPSVPLTVVHDGGPASVLSDPDVPALVRSPRVTSPELQMRVDVSRMDALIRRVGALAVNRAELAQVRQAVADTQSDMEHAITRLGELSVRLADYQPSGASGAMPLAAAPANPAPSLMTRVLRGDRHGKSHGRHPGPAGLAEVAVPETLNLERYTEYDEMTRALAEAVADVGASAGMLRTTLRRLDGLAQTQEGLATAIQQAVMQVRLVPLSELMPRLQRAARAVAQQLGKSVTFSVRGEMTEIDRDVSDALAESLTQLARNAVAHGIEFPDERQALGKPLEGNLWLRAYYSSNGVNIELGDDGRGMNPDQILAAALLSGAIDQATARSLSPEQALNLIFEQGVTTVVDATAAAGHGIGMAEVAEIVARLRGTIQMRSMPGQGTTFHIRVPISLSIVRALHVQVAGQGYAIPFSSVLQSLSVPPAAPADQAWSATSGRRMQVMLGEQQVDVPVYALAELLGQPYRPSQHEIALVVEFGRQPAALIVDAAVEDSDAVVRSLPPHLQRRAIHGAIVTPTGDVLLLLDLQELAGRVLANGRPHARQPEPEPRPTSAASSRILVVDDSLSIRRAVQAALGHAGFEVQVARDGMEALEHILADPPRAVVLDIEMPRLDGYELLSVLRSQERFAMLPVALLTSRGAERHRRHAEVLGADAYLVKPCPDDELVATVRRLVSRQD
jgi:chemotaxis protein histidine kinase CheA/ActR/RegA family two-component response regulator